MNQPQGSTSIVIATFNDDNERHDRVVRLEQIDGRELHRCESLAQGLV